MSRVKNDAKLVQDLPFLGLLIASSPGGIESEEALGQQSLIGSTQIPTDCDLMDDQLLKLGFTELGKKPRKDIFRDAILPQGWKLIPTDHSMHSDLLDEKGRRRAGVFYKAAFYDRRADIRFTARFHYGREYDKSTDILETWTVKDGGSPIFECSEHTIDFNEDPEGWRAEIHGIEDRLTKKCQDFLRGMGIDIETLRDPMLHWDAT